MASVSPCGVDLIYVWNLVTFSRKDDDEHSHSILERGQRKISNRSSASVRDFVTKLPIWQTKQAPRRNKSLRPKKKLNFSLYPIIYLPKWGAFCECNELLESKKKIERKVQAFNFCSPHSLRWWLTLQFALFLRWAEKMEANRGKRGIVPFVRSPSRDGSAPNVERSKRGKTGEFRTK